MLIMIIGIGPLHSVQNRCEMRISRCLKAIRMFHLGLVPKLDCQKRGLQRIKECGSVCI